MALYPNGSYLSRSPNRFFGASAAAVGGSGAGYQIALRNRSDYMNRFMNTNYSKLESIPSGMGMESPFRPRTAGGMGSYKKATLAETATATGVLGMPGEAAASFLIQFAAADGQLIVSGTGSSTVSITWGAALLVASLSGVGSSSFSVTFNTPTLGAEAGLGASTSFSLSGTLTPYAIGHMEGAALPYTELSPQSLAEAVWSKVLEGTYTAAELQKIMSAALAGKVSGAGANAPVFRAVDDSDDRITATTDANGNRLTVTISV